MIRPAVAMRFGMKVPIFDIQAHGQAHVRIRGKLLASGIISRRAAETKHRGVKPLQHSDGEIDLHGPPIAGIGDKAPGRRQL